MGRKLLISLLTIATIGFGSLSASRALMTYTENGTYFDGLVVYDVAARDAYLFLTVLLLIATLATAFFWKGRALKK
jgi:uncharacterized membrane protein